MYSCLQLDDAIEYTQTMNVMHFPGRTRHAQQAFTIVELLIVIVIIAVLAAISIVGYSGISQRATEAAISSKESQAKRKLEVYKVENGSYPPDQETFDSLTGQNPEDTLYTTYTSTPPYDSYTLSTAGGDSVAHLPPTDCPAGFVPVPGNTSFGTDGFCVMKYEAKNAGSNIPVSQASGAPWTSVSQANAITYSQNVAGCTGCHLITEAEWMTLAANVLSVSSNWSGESVGSGFIYNGHNNNNPSSFLAASVNDADGMYGITGGTGATAAYNQRRTLTLTNGEVIWDLAGNAQEWTQGVITGAQPGASGFSAREYPTISNWGNLPETSRPTAISGLVGVGTWNSSNGIGNINSSTSATGGQGYIRGGHRCGNQVVGILSLDLRASPSCSGQNTIGFRVAR